MKGVDDQLKKLEDYRSQLRYLEVLILISVAFLVVSGACNKRKRRCPGDHRVPSFGWKQAGFDSGPRFCNECC